MAEYRYRIFINKYEESTYSLKYDFQSIKNIELRISNHGALIAFTMKTKKSVNDILKAKDKLIQDAIRKAVICSTLFSSAPIEVQAMYIVEDSNDTPAIYLSAENEPSFIFSMLDCIYHPIPPCWKNKGVMQLICDYTKTKENSDSRFAAFYSMLTSKAKHYEIERFIHLWTAMNGLYSYAASKATPYRPIKNGKQKVISGEENKYRFLALLSGYRFDGFLCKSIENTVINKAELLLANCAEQDENAFITAMNQITSQAGVSNLPMDNDAFLIFEFAYKIRCKYFHGEAPILFICFADDYRLRMLRYINQRLERYLDTELPKWMERNDYKCEEITAIAPSFVLKNEMK